MYTYIHTELYRISCRILLVNSLSNFLPLQLYSSTYRLVVLSTFI